MATDTSDTKFLRLIAAQLGFSTAMQTAREMFGKSYFACGAAEKATVDQTAFQAIAQIYQALPKSLEDANMGQIPVGFQGSGTST
jgi:hypothetical protein